MHLFGYDMPASGSAMRRLQREARRARRAIERNMPHFTSREVSNWLPSMRDMPSMRHLPSARDLPSLQDLRPMLSHGGSMVSRNAAGLGEHVGSALSAGAHRARHNPVALLLLLGGAGLVAAYVARSMNSSSDPRSGSNAGQGRGSNRNPTEDEVWSVLKRQRVCVLTTRDNDHILQRPMLSHLDMVQKRILFVSSRSSEQASSLNGETEAGVSVSDTGADMHISLSGKLRPLEDKALVERIWNRDIEMWFPDGPDDPDIKLMEFKPERGEFWKNASPSLINRLKLAVTHQVSSSAQQKPESGTLNAL